MRNRRKLEIAADLGYGGATVEEPSPRMKRLRTQTHHRS
jgi:hypothetical protein